MVVRPVYYPESNQQSNMQYPPPGSPPPGQGGWESQARPSGYQEYPPPQGSPPYGAPPPQQAPGPYAYQGGEGASYYGNTQQPPAYRPGQAYGGPPPSQPYGSAPYGQSYQGSPQGPYGYEHPNANPFGQPPAAARNDTPEIKQEGSAPYPGPGAGPQNAEDERGLMGALAGATAGGYAGHKMHHGFLGAMGGAYAGHKLEEAYKDHKKHSQPPSPAPPAAGGAYHQPQQHHGGGDAALRGNFSASATNITLDRDHDLIASCADVHGHRKLTSISLNDVVTNDDGHFRWVDPRSGGAGNFGASARNVRLVDGGRVLEAELCRCDGSWRRDTLRLDERIENADGDLRFV